jgi:O-antigen/teichoic acid export membrane protein
VRTTVLKNTLFITLGQILSIPLSLALTALTARYLGAVAMGYMYLANTWNSLGFMAVEWGQGGALPARVAQNRSSAGELLGTSLVWRCCVAVIVFVALTAACRAFGYDAQMQQALAILFLCHLVSSVCNATQHTILGLERTDVGAIRQVLELGCSLLFVAPILILGGSLRASLYGYLAASSVALVYVFYALSGSGIGRLTFRRGALKTLLAHGTPFAFLAVAMVLQPYIDAVFLSKLASTEVVGWHAAARKLIGFLIFPSSALIGALYPTLCRLYASDANKFLETARGALRGTTLIVFPVALGCALYPGIGISVYGHANFAAAEGNLRVLAVFVFLVYFTMVLGITVLASGKQRAWGIVQSLCVAVSLVADPILVPWFERRTGNGGLGICSAAVLSEFVVLACGVWLAPSGLFNSRFWRVLAQAFVAGLVMVTLWRVLRSVRPFVAAPIAVTGYGLALWLVGGIDESVRTAVRSLVGRKLARFRAVRP